METFSALLALCAGNSPVTGEFPAHKGQWRGASMFSLISPWINGWVNNHEAGDLRHHRGHNDVIVMAIPWHQYFLSFHRFPSPRPESSKLPARSSWSISEHTVRLSACAIWGSGTNCRTYRWTANRRWWRTRNRWLWRRRWGWQRRWNSKGRRGEERRRKIWRRWWGR